MNSQKTAMRLFAEGSVIIVSILVAFWIDASWAERLARIEEQDAIAALHAEALANQLVLSDVVRRVEADHAGARAFFELGERESTTASVRSADPILQSLWRPNTYALKDGALNGLTMSGRLSLIQDAELRRLLADWQSQSADLAERQGNLAALEVAVLTAVGHHEGAQAWLMTDARPGILVFGEVAPDAPAALLISVDLRAIRLDPDVMAAASAMQFQRQVYLMILRQLATQLDQLEMSLDVAMR
jgi:hypothetical protein